MFSPDLTLSLFISSIPICHSEADLGSILQIFHQTNSDCLAISDVDKNWGIISAHSLLAFLSQSGSQFKSLISNDPKQSLQQSNLTLNKNSDHNQLKNLITPATIYPAETSLLEFFQSLDNNYWQTSSTVALIINSTGEPQGKLDQNKLLRYLASGLNQQNLHFQSHSSLPTSSLSLLSLLDNLSLPLKIETIEQKSCYENSCWQKLIAHHREEPIVPSQELNVSIANWWMKKQLDAQSSDNLSPEGQYQQAMGNFKINHADNFCCLGNDYYSLSQSQTLSQLINFTSNSNQLKDARITDSLVIHTDNLAKSHHAVEQGRPNSLNTFSDEIRVEAGLEWNYIKIPFTLDSNQVSEAAIAAYWLVLAIKPSLLNSKHAAQNLSVSPQPAINKLLGTISHELKSPLTGIVGLSSLLESEKLGKLNPRQAKYVQLINNSGQKLMSIVHDLVEITTLTTGKFKLKPEQIDLTALFNKLYQQILVKFETIDAVESDLLMSTAGISLNISAGSEIVIADRLRLSSILSHLMLEIMQFAGSPSIAIAIEVQSHHPQGIIIIIKNKTTNMSNSPIQGNLILQNDSGTGLNLTIAEYLAQTLQGNIKSIYTSEGCSFTLILPKVQTNVDTLATKSHEANINHHQPLKKLTILCLYPELEVIDINLSDNHGLGFNLKKWAEQDWYDDSQQQSIYRHRIIEANGLEQAHTLARIWHLDAIVLDGYQIKDSLQYLKLLQESKYLSRLPLITLDPKTTAAANQIQSLNVYPCLLPAQHRSIQDLMQVIQIAIDQ